MPGHNHTQTQTRRRLVTLADAADYLGCSQKTLRRKIAAGQLHGYRFGKRAIRVDLNEVDALLTPIPTTGATA